MARMTVYACLLSALLGAVLAWCFQAVRLGAELSDERLQASQYREQIAEERTAAGRRVLAVERSINEKYQGVLNEARQKQAVLQAAADRAGRERDGLRKQLSAAEQRFADAAPSALMEYASTVNQLFGQCSERCTELAARADGHAADAATCRAAWPVIPVQP